MPVSPLIIVLHHRSKGSHNLRFLSAFTGKVSSISKKKLRLAIAHKEALFEWFDLTAKDIDCCENLTPKLIPQHSKEIHDVYRGISSGT